MCMIAICPAGVALSKDQVLDIMLFADDGLGVMYCGSHGLIVERKLIRDPLRVWKWLSLLPIEVERFIHFRRTTRGETNRANLHPLVFRNVRFGLMHNGTLPETLVPFNLPDGMSDTVYFVRRYLSRMPVAALTSASLWDLIGAATEDDRMVCLDGKTGVSYFTNREWWFTGHGGILISNNYAIKDEKLWGVPKRKPLINPGWRSPTGKADYEDWWLNQGDLFDSPKPTLNGATHEPAKHLDVVGKEPSPDTSSTQVAPVSTGTNVEVLRPSE